MWSSSWLCFFSCILFLRFLCVSSRSVRFSSSVCFNPQFVFPSMNSSISNTFLLFFLTIVCRVPRVPPLYIFLCKCFFFVASSMCSSPVEKVECVPPWTRLHVCLHRLQHNVRHPDAHLQLRHQSGQRGLCSWISGRCKRRISGFFPSIKCSITLSLQGNGFIASAVIYGVFSIASWLAPSVVAWKGPRWRILVFQTLSSCIAQCTPCSCLKGDFEKSICCTAKKISFSVSRFSILTLHLSQVCHVCRWAALRTIYRAASLPKVRPMHHYHTFVYICILSIHVFVYSVFEY